MYPKRRKPLPIPLAKRVKALCHTELQFVNEVVDCNACVMHHLEWFHTSTAEAIQVARKWTAWIKTGP